MSHIFLVAEDHRVSVNNFNILKLYPAKVKTTVCCSGFPYSYYSLCFLLVYILQLIFCVGCGLVLYLKSGV
jgi:hypothetical protein